MAGQAADTDLYLKQVEERLRALEDRVSALETRMVAPATIPAETIPESRPIEQKKREGTTSAVPVLGKAVMAIAGAYLLRAIAESGTVPKLPLLLLAVAYSAVWLVWAVRTHRKSHFASTVFGLTVALILAPLLWEGTVRFQELTAGFASVVLVGYVALSLGLAWKERLEAIPWIAVLAAVGTALALLVATHELSTLTTALIVIALITEVTAWGERWRGLRAIPALGADFAIGILGMVMATPQGVPAGYRPMSAAALVAFGLALPLIYAVSMTLRAFALDRKWTAGEVTQAVLAFVLGTWLSLRATQGGAVSALGVVFLVLAVGCYWGALKRFASPEMRWNRRVSTNYAAGLVLAGIFLLFSGDLRALLLSSAAVALTFVFTRTGYVSLAIHGTLYLLVASVECRLFVYSGSALAGVVPSWPLWSFWAATTAALAVYLLGSRVQGEGWKSRVLWLIPSSVLALAVTALVIAGTARFSSAALTASRLSMVRTVATCIIALALAYTGSRWNRLELGWLAYGAIALGALKLLLEDLRFGNAGTLMVSLLIYGLILILLPRVTRFGRVEL